MLRWGERHLGYHRGNADEQKLVELCLYDHTKRHGFQRESDFLHRVTQTPWLSSSTIVEKLLAFYVTVLVTIQGKQCPVTKARIRQLDILYSQHFTGLDCSVSVRESLLWSKLTGFYSRALRNWNWKRQESFLKSICPGDIVWLNNTNIQSSKLNCALCSWTNYVHLVIFSNKDVTSRMNRTIQCPAAVFVTLGVLFCFFDLLKTCVQEWCAEQSLTGQFKPQKQWKYHGAPEKCLVYVIHALCRISLQMFHHTGRHFVTHNAIFSVNFYQSACTCVLSFCVPIFHSSS